MLIFDSVKTSNMREFKQAVESASLESDLSFSGDYLTEVTEVNGGCYYVITTARARFAFPQEVAPMVRRNLRKTLKYKRRKITQKELNAGNLAIQRDFADCVEFIRLTPHEIELRKSRLLALDLTKSEVIKLEGEVRDLRDTLARARKRLSKLAKSLGLTNYLKTIKSNNYVIPK